MQQIVLGDGSRLEAEVFVFANGPWLGRSFPQLLDAKLRVTRQPVFFFGPPASFARQLDRPFPVWMNRDTANQERCYGVYDPGLSAFKLAYTQLEEEELDPTTDERSVRPEEIAHARYLMEKRFAFMKDAPLLFTKVCQHTDTPDKNFILDRHPEAEDLWLLGGGSGHAFKHGPAIGEMAANAIRYNHRPGGDFTISRLSGLESFTKQHK
jgi:glycine/D-amino acid oxidase-like deaminating enzyme